MNYKHFHTKPIHAGEPKPHLNGIELRKIFAKAKDERRDCGRD